MTAPLWGYPWHGLYLYGAYGVGDRLRPGGAAGPELLLHADPFPEALPGALSEAYGNVSGVSEVHILRVPGMPVIALSPEAQAEQAALGRHWQNYTLMHSGYRMYYGPRYMVHGRHAGGWVLIDAAGERWSVRQQTGTELMNGAQDRGASLDISLKLEPFGYIGQQREPVTVSASLASLQQSTPSLSGDPNVTLRVWSVASHGRDVLIAVFPGASFGASSVPCGWLRLQLSGSGEAFTAALSVLHSRATALGARSQPPDTSTSCSVQITFSQISPTVARASGSDVKTGAAIVAGSTWLQELKRDRYLQGRILNVVFDDADQLVTLTMDQHWSLLITASTPTLSGFSGDLALSAFSEGIRIQGDFTFTRSGSATYLNRWEVVLRRNGVEMDRADWSDSKSTAWSQFVGASVIVTAPTVGDARYSAGTSVGMGWDWDQSLTFAAGGATRAQKIGTWTGGYLTPSTPTLSAVALSIDMPALYPYSKCIYELRRLSNHLYDCSYGLVTSEAGFTSVGHTYGAVATQAAWSNPNPTTQFTSRGSYNPATHELVMVTDDSINGLFLHI